jgi:hypothetical protein
MAKGFGIAALVFAILAIFIPLGIVLSVVAIVLAIVAALAGDKIFSIATALIALVNTFVLSPSTWILLAGSDANASSVLKVFFFVICMLPIGAVALRSAGKLSIPT